MTVACVRYSQNAEDSANAAPFYAAARCAQCGYWNDLKLIPGGPPLGKRGGAFVFVCALGCGTTRRKFEARARYG